jgi:ATP-dependent Clp protease ATP-binding subunit ClpA
LNGYNFTDRVRKVLQMAREEAARPHHEYVGTEHILLAILREGEGVAAAALTNLNVDFEEVTAAVNDTVKEGKYDATGPDLPYTSRAKKILEFSMSEARELNHSYVGTEHLLLGVIREEKGIGAQTLKDVGITLAIARAEVLRLLGTEGQVRETRVYADAADQIFKMAIALVELHRVRGGTYPDSLDDLQVLGAYDRAALVKGLRYEKLADGYALDVVTPKGEKPALRYPPDFCRRLGIRRTNVDRSSP